MKETEQGAILKYMDITNEWTKKDKKGSLVERSSYIVDGNNYIVDGKHVIYNLISKKKNQSPNFIFDMTECPLSLEEIESQIAGVYSSTHTRFVNEIIVMRNGKIIKAYRRQ